MIYRIVYKSLWAYCDRVIWSFCCDMIAAAPILWDDCKLKKEKKKRVNACTAKQILWECKWMSMDAPKDLLLPVEDKKTR